MPTKERRLREEAKRSGQKIPSTPPDRRPTEGDWVEIIRVESPDRVRVGDVVKIIEDDHSDDHSGAPYKVPENGIAWLYADQVKLTDKRPEEALEPCPRTEEHLFREAPAQATPAEDPHEDVVVLPASFADEVERAQALAEAEEDKNKRHKAFLAKDDELSNNVIAILREQKERIQMDLESQHDYEIKAAYLRALRVRKSK